VRGIAHTPLDIGLHTPMIGGLKWQPGIGDSTNQRRFSRHFEPSNPLPRQRVRYQKQFLAIQLTPTTGVPSGMPYEVDGALPQCLPREYLNYSLCRIDLD